jgi:hypothetical protein
MVLTNVTTSGVAVGATVFVVDVHDEYAKNMSIELYCRIRPRLSGPYNMTF